MIDLQCSTCYNQFQTDDHHAGQTVTCPNCESPIAVPLPAGATPPPPPKKYNELTILGFVCGLVGLLISPCCMGLGVPVGGIGLTCSILGFLAAQKKGGSLGLAIAGIVLGGLDLLLGISWVIWAVASG